MRRASPGIDDITVAVHRDGDRLPDGCDGSPVGLPAVHLVARPAMHRQSGGAGLLEQARVRDGIDLAGVPADADLGRDRHPGRGGRCHRAAHDLGQTLRLQQQSTAGAMLSHFLHRAAGIDVEQTHGGQHWMGQDDLNSRGEVIRLGTEQLDRNRLLVWRDFQITILVAQFRIVPDATGADQLGDNQSGAEAMANAAERHVRRAGHRRQGEAVLNPAATDHQYTVIHIGLDSVFARQCHRFLHPAIGRQAARHWRNLLVLGHCSPLGCISARLARISCRLTLLGVTVET